MSHATGVGSYRAVLTLPFALRTFVPALIGRLGYALFSLATLFTVQQATSSYAVAGLAVAVFGLASITLPAKARLVDRLGQHRVLPVLALSCAAALVATFFLTDPVALVTLVGFAGLAAPPLGPSMRSTWRRLTAGTGLKERAYAVDSIAEETLYLTGPLLAGLLIAIGPARWAMLVMAALLTMGTLGMVAAPPARHREPSDDRRLLGPGPLRSFRLRGLLAVVLVAGTSTSIALTCTAIVAQDRGHPGAAGLLEAAAGVGSVTGGLAWARRRHRHRRSTQIAFLLFVLSAGLVAEAVAPDLLTLGLLMALTGTAIAPLFVVAYLTADDVVAPAERTEAGTWVNVSNNAGNAAGAALAGTIADAAGTSSAFLAGAALLAVAALISACFPNRS
jgi:predicted MFS family arabinose efflux permease